jgi:hypothetical protein
VCAGGNHGAGHHESDSSADTSDPSMTPHLAATSGSPAITSNSAPATTTPPRTFHPTRPQRQRSQHLRLRFNTQLLNQSLVSIEYWRKRAQNVRHACTASTSDSSVVGCDSHLLRRTSPPLVDDCLLYRGRGRRAHSLLTRPTVQRAWMTTGVVGACSPFSEMPTVRRDSGPTWRHVPRRQSLLPL